MELKEVKKLIKMHGVKSWVECGVNVVKVGDKLITDGEKFSRLDVYSKDGFLKFVDEKDCICGSCGGIELNNGSWIHYNIL